MKAKYLVAATIALAIIILGYSAWKSNHTNVTERVTEDDSPSTTTTQNTNTTSLPVSPTAKNGSTSPTSGGLKYDDALAAYAGKLFQFSSCVTGPPPVISPGSLSLKQGSKYMIDNRDKTAHTIRVGTTAYSLGAQSFRIVQAPTKGTYNITCDGGGAAQLQVQP